MSTVELLVEIGTEELPPKALKSLSYAFLEGIRSGLNEAGLVHGELEAFASPRRLAVRLIDCAARQADRSITRRGPSFEVAYTDGEPSKALLGFAKSCGVEVTELRTLSTEKGAWLVFDTIEKGKTIQSLFPDLVQQSLDKLPIPKRMRWGNGAAEFVRPVHWVVMLADNEVVPCELFGLAAGNISYGHRFHAPEAITLDHPSNYESLLSNAKVLASFEARKSFIQDKVAELAESFGNTAIMSNDLLEEVTALVEWPVPVVGEFDPVFLEVPHEVLIYTMQGDQKYFGMCDDSGALQSKFITISNIESLDPAKVAEGNERVIRPRFSDAAFFWEQDKKETLSSRREALKKVVFQKELGSVFDKTERVAVLCEYLAGLLGEDKAEARRAAELSKCDLVSNMVFEFTDLQGTMGRYYANNDGESEAVAAALEEQYLPRYSGDDLPATPIGTILALADRLDTLACIFAIGQKPTGTKDPFALRRVSLGVLRILIEKCLPIELAAIIEVAGRGAQRATGKMVDTTETHKYVLERLKNYYQEQGIDGQYVEAVDAVAPAQPHDFDRRVQAVAAFAKLPEAEILAAVNKRIGNILKQVESPPDTFRLSECQAGAESTLGASVRAVNQTVTEAISIGKYDMALTELTKLAGPADQFFEDVMVMADDPEVRQNRIGLLNHMNQLFIQIADLSVLAKT